LNFDYRENKYGSREEVKCYNCNERGHIQKDCKEKRRSFDRKPYQKRSRSRSYYRGGEGSRDRSRNKSRDRSRERSRDRSVKNSKERSVGSRNSRNYKFSEKRGEKNDSRKSSVASKKSYHVESGSPRESERVVQEN
jgi:hypothetical protein